MKKRDVAITAILSIFLVVSLASAADVAYLYRKNSQVDNNVLDIFNELSLTVDLVQEDSLPNNFNSYKLIYVGKENYRNDENFPVNNYPSVISNRNPPKSWGLTDSDGVSQMGATSPLNVIVNSNSIQVYTLGLKQNKLAVSYSYLDKDNKAPALQQIAAAKTTSSGVKFGDVVSYAEAGAQLFNSKIQNKKLCFFGIVESDYWTPEAKDLFKECIKFVVGPAPECTINSECPSDELSQSFCQSNNVKKTKTTSACVENKCVSSQENISIESCLFGCEAGACKPAPSQCTINADCNSTFSEPFCQENNIYKTQFSYSCILNQCIASSNESILIQTCAFGCSQAQCLPEPQTENHDVALIDFANSTNKIQIKYYNASEGGIISDNQLQCNKDYRITIMVENKGSFTENVSFIGSFGPIELNHNPISNFVVGDQSSKWKKLSTTNLTQGYYNLSIEAIIDGFADANPIDNKALREIFVSC